MIARSMEDTLVTKRMKGDYPKDLDQQPLTDYQKSLLGAFIAQYETPLKIVIACLRSQFLLTKYLRIPECDVEGVAYHGLMCAARRYDSARPGHDGKVAGFKTYGLYWVRSKLGQLCENELRQRPRGDFKLHSCVEGDIVDFRDRPDFCPDELAVVLDMMRHLTPRTQQVIKYRYGLDGGYQMTLNEISDVIGVTRERVRQIERHGIERMKVLVNRKLGRSA